MTNHNKRSRVELFGANLATSTWPHPDSQLIPEMHREPYGYRVKAIQLYADGCSLKDIEEQTGIKGSLVNYLAERCLRLHPDGRIWGFRAAVPNVRISEYTRHSPIKPKLPEAQGGHAGALGQLLETYPNLNDDVVAWVKKEKKKYLVHEHRIRLVDVHREFLRLLRNLGVKSTEWPFNTKYLGLRTIGGYVNKILETDFAGGVTAREDGAARAHLSVGKGKAPLLQFTDPFDVVEIDAHLIDSHLTVGFSTPQGTIVEVLLSRIWLIAAVDRSSTAVLAYTVVYRSEVGASDVLRVIAKSVSETWKPLPLSIPDLSYLPGSGLPSGIIPGLAGTVYGSLFLDGALAHLSKAVRERARKKLGFSINWGPVRHFERRPNVERLFRSIHDDIFGRLPSTTGSNPQNSRAEHGELLAETYKIRAAEAEQLLDVYIARHNATPSEGIFNISPLEYLRQKAAENHFIPRHLPASVLTRGPVFPLRIAVVVRGGQKDGRRPYIQFQREHYTSDLLANSSGLIGKSLTIEVDEDDLRQVRAFLNNGESIGFLTATGKWRLSKHDLKTRKIINSLLSNRTLVLANGRDPVQGYLSYLSKGTKKNRLKTDMVPAASAATEAVRIATAADIPLKLNPKGADSSPAAEQKKPFRSLMTQPMPDLNAIINRGGK
jgi:hypothetical protein